MASCIYQSPVGPIRITSDGRALTRVELLSPEGCGAEEADGGDDPLLRETVEQLRAYFAGERQHFELPLADASTPAGPRLRGAIAAVGYGETASYGELARRFGSSPRAIGQACRRNPFPILIPCHRVLSAAGAAEYYSAGAGVSTKQWLLNHERG